MSALLALLSLCCCPSLNFLGNVADDGGLYTVEGDALKTLEAAVRSWVIPLSWFKLMVLSEGCPGLVFAVDSPPRGSHCSPACFEGVLGAVRTPDGLVLGTSLDLWSELG